MISSNGSLRRDGPRDGRPPAAPEAEHQDFVQFLGVLLASGRVDGELRDLIRATLGEDDRFRQWQGVFDILERGVHAGLFLQMTHRVVRGVEHVDFMDLATRRVFSAPRPPVMALHVAPLWPGRTIRLPVPLPTSEESLADALHQFLEAEVRGRLGADVAAVYLQKGDKALEYVACAHGEGYTLPGRFLPEHVDRWALSRGLTVVAEDLRRDAELQRWTERGTLRSVAASPLGAQDGGRPLGVLEAWSKRPYYFRGEELGQLVTLGHFLADLAQNALYLKDQIFRDALTGIFNRRYFDQYLLDQEMLRSRRTRREFALVLADIDHFKKVNDMHGHGVGDKVLRQVATLLSDRIRPRVDIVSRYGGDEFAILLPELTSGASGVRVVAERLRAEVAAFDFRGICPELTAPLTISLGAAVYRGIPELGEASRHAEKQKVLSHADQALYRAKREARNCARIWDEPPVAAGPASEFRGAERNERV